MPVPPLRCRSSHHDVGGCRTDAVDRGIRFLGFANDLDAFDRSETRGHPCADRNRVVDEEHAQGWLGQA